MAGLTDSQEAFCKNIVLGKSQYESYCLAYPNQAKTPVRNTIDSNASQLMSDTKILQRIEQLRKPIKKKFNKSVEDILEEIDSLKGKAISDDDKRIALDCLKEMNKMLGNYEKDNKQKTGVVVNMPSVEINGEELEFNIGKSPDEETKDNQ